jgi:hypothetical protein
VNLLRLSWFLFAAGACGGALFVLMSVRRIAYPRWFAAGHGLVGLTACVLLTIGVLDATSAAPMRAAWALALLVVAMLGGAFLFGWLQVRRARVPLALGHGALALVGLYLLYGAAFPAAA